MITCRYISGDSSEIGDMKYEAVGQYAEFSESLFRDVVVGGAAFLPEDYFKKFGITQEEIDLNGYPGSRDESSEFSVKLVFAQQAFNDIRTKLLEGCSVESVLADIG